MEELASMEAVATAAADPLAAGEPAPAAASSSSLQPSTPTAATPASDRLARLAAALPRSIPGGGSFLPKRESSDLAELIIIHGDLLVAAAPSRTEKVLPPLVKEAVAAALARIESHPKKRVICCTGGAALTHLMAEECVRSVGLDSFGPGRKVDILLKERSGEFGNVWESCLLVKALAKRQCKLIHFEQVVSVAAAPFAPAVRRVLAFVLADWKPAVEITAVTVDADEALAARAAAIGAYDDAWFDARSTEYSAHPSYPATAPTLRVEKVGDTSAGAPANTPAPHNYRGRQSRAGSKTRVDALNFSISAPHTRSRAGRAPLELKKRRPGRPFATGRRRRRGRR